ncbi:hypothetical protein [Eubacterium sp.]|uniref:hypothetical protein n=1 Tax=Eubacterium sp. TaxID=142586 RepID=UPI0026E06CE3|nr:hypothetical protein [Eubacterium sp.]MDO5432954.1 hypothetical protein [Eubacterium sp.]
MKYDIIKQNTHKILGDWKEYCLLAPTKTQEIISKARLDWVIELTDCLGIWLEKGKTMNEGELILANANLGSVVESWLKFFYCIYYDDYEKDTRHVTDKANKLLPPNRLKFDRLRLLSSEIIFAEENDKCWNNWIHEVQLKRNAIHSFNDRELGDYEDFANNVDKLYEFINIIDERLPPIEDYLFR